MGEGLTPFLAAIAERGPARPLGAALPAIEAPPVISPWTPRPEAPVAEAAAAAAAVPAEPAEPPPPPIDIDAIRDEAIEAGRAEGLRETAALRAKLAALATALEAARAQLAAPAAELIADAAATAIAAWTSAGDRRELFAPVVRAWLERCREPAVARVHPADADGLRAAIGEAAISVEPDPSIKPGDLHLRASALELDHRWDARLRELREAIAASLEEARP